MNKPNLVEEVITPLLGGEESRAKIVLVDVPDPVTLYYVMKELLKALDEKVKYTEDSKTAIAISSIIWNSDGLGSNLERAFRTNYQKLIIVCLTSDSYLVKERVSQYDDKTRSKFFELSCPSYVDLYSDDLTTEASTHPDIKNLDEEVSEPNIQVLDNWRLIPPNENDFTSVMSAINDAIARYKGRPIIVSDFYLKAYVDVATSLVDMYNPKTKTLNTDDLSVRRLIDIISDFCNLVAFDMSIFPEFIGSWENVLRSFTKIINDRYFMCNTTFEMLYRTIENSNNKGRENHE